MFYLLEHCLFLPRFFYCFLTYYSVTDSFIICYFVWLPLLSLIRLFHSFFSLAFLAHSFSFYTRLFCKLPFLLFTYIFVFGLYYGNAHINGVPWYSSQSLYHWNRRFDPALAWNLTWEFLFANNTRAIGQWWIIVKKIYYFWSVKDMDYHSYRYHMIERRRPR